MKNISNLSDHILLSDIKNLAGEERKITTLILQHLKEIDRRRLFASLGFSSLFEYCRQVIPNFL
jgi:hypothetical protein